MIFPVFIKTLTGTLLEVNFRGSLPLLQKEIQTIEPEFHPLTQDIIRIGVHEGEERNFNSVKEGDLLGLMISVPPIAIIKNPLITFGNGIVKYQQYCVQVYERKGENILFSQQFYYNSATGRVTFDPINTIDEYRSFEFLFSSKPIWYNSLKTMLSQIKFLNNPLVIDEIVRLWEQRII